MNPLLRKYISRNVRINNGDTLGHVKLIVRLEQCNQGDQREQDDKEEVSIIMFGMNESLGFQKYSICRWISIFFSPWLSEGEWLHSPGGELVQAGIGEHVADQHHCPDHQRHVHAHAGGA